MTPVERVVAEMVNRAGWQSLPARRDMPQALRERLPADLRAFNELCGGIRTAQGLAIAADVRHAQRAVLGQEHPDDRSFHWYVIAEDGTAGTAARAVIDFHPARLGRCYDGFWDSFGVAGSMAVIAASFTELLTRILEADGAAYWPAPALDLGDAYD